MKVFYRTSDKPALLAGDPSFKFRLFTDIPEFNGVPFTEDFYTGPKSAIHEGDLKRLETGAVPAIGLTEDKPFVPDHVAQAMAQVQAKLSTPPAEDMPEVLKESVLGTSAVAEIVAGAVSESLLEKAQEVSTVGDVVAPTVTEVTPEEVAPVSVEGATLPTKEEKLKAKFDAASLVPEEDRTPVQKRDITNYNKFLGQAQS